MSQKNTTLLDRAIIIATNSHAGQTDKKCEPYILHPLRVMSDPHLEEDIARYEGGEINNIDLEIARCIAVLHDVLEDCEITRGNLESSLHKNDIVFRNAARRILSGVELLTKREDETGKEGYKKFIQRIRDGNNSIVKAVKLADIRDNSDPRRLIYLSADQQKYLIKKYKLAKHMLM